MSSKILLPEKVSLKQVSVELSLDRMPYISALRTLLMYSDNFDLPIYIDQSINGYRIDKPTEEILDESGEITQVKTCEESTCLEPLNKLRIESVADAYIKNNAYFLSLYLVSCDNKSYYTVDETNEWLKSILINTESCYINKNDLIEFSNNYSNDKEPINNKGSKKQIHGKLEQRRLAFKTWLATKADIKITADFQYQQCYEIIGNPTRDEVWDMLQKVDGKLFTSGQDDFNAKQGVIKFKLGTGKSR